MQKILDFLQKIHVPSELITAMQDEKQDVVLDDLAKKYLDSRNTYYESSLLKEKIDKTRSETAAGMTLKSIKKINELLGMGLSNPQMEEYKDMESFIADAKKHKETYEATLKTSTNEDLVSELNKYKLAATERQKEIEKLAGEYKTFASQKEHEKNEAIRLFEARQYWNKLVMEDKDIAEVPGKAFALESIEERIFSKYRVEKDGRIFNPDGSVATHPDKEVAVTTLAEIYPYFKEKAGLQKVSNGGQGGGVTIVDGKKVITGDIGPATREMMRQFEDMNRRQ